MSKSKVVVIQGAGMDLRGKVQIEIFGPQTLTEINAGIESAAGDCGLDVEFMQSNDENETVKFIQDLDHDTWLAAIINPSGFTTNEQIAGAISSVEIPFYEVHASNPSARGVVSSIQPVCKGGICGFGYAGYAMVLRQISTSARPINNT